MTIEVPFFRPQISEEAIREVSDALRSGWLTTGPRVRRFEEQFAEAVGAEHALAVNSCTAALHLALVALGLKPNDAVLVPTMTFAATAEVVRYSHATVVLVDCDPTTGNICLADAARKVAAWRSGDLPRRLGVTAPGPLVGLLPVHVAGLLIDPTELEDFAREHQLWMVEDAAHSFPAAVTRTDDNGNVLTQRCGENTARVSCFSFYANKTITTGEGGMAVTSDATLLEEMRLMSLHGLSKDAWKRYSGSGQWDYRILAPGYKYNLTDIAAAIGLHQLARAEPMRREREAIARRYLHEFSDNEMFECPPDPDDRVHSWHLFPIRLRLETLTRSRDEIVQDLRSRGVGFSVHWRPLHLHPYWSENQGWQADELPQATALFPRLISLPVFPGMRDEEVSHVTRTLQSLLEDAAR